MPTMKKKILNDEEQYNEDIKFNTAIRETFLNRFVHIFLMYENFVIMPDQVNNTLYIASFKRTVRILAFAHNFTTIRWLFLI